MERRQANDRSSSGAAWQWLVEGWHHLRDKAATALTYFTPQEEADARAQRWGVLATDVTEQGDEVVIELELPGLDKADLEVEVRHDQVVVTGEKRSSATRRDGAVVVTERAYGRFKRVIPAPFELSTEGSRARYKNGVLEIVVAKNRSTQPRAIPISRV